MTLGFIGTGTIATAFIEGVQRVGRDEPIVVSPRSEATSVALVARYPGVRRAADNAEVAREADIVFLAMKPAQVEAALLGIVFRPEQLVVSFVANLPLAELQALAPDSIVARILPLPAIARGLGPVLAAPRLPAIEALLVGMGHAIFPASEAEFAALTPVSAFMSSYFELQGRLTGFIAGRGVDEATASLYVRTLFEGLADTAINTPDERLGELPLEHETRGGLNERVRRTLLEAGWFDRPDEVLGSLNSLKRDALK